MTKSSTTRADTCNASMESKNGPSVIGASTPRLGPNHQERVAMNIIARETGPHASPERWAEIERTGYYVSSLGGIRNPYGRRLKPFVGTKAGHLKIDLPKGRRAVHRLVLEAFFGPAPHGLECCHRDGDPTNNRIENLRWDTRSANVLDIRLVQTHCPHGHEYTPENTYLYPSTGWRACRVCKRKARGADRLRHRLAIAGA